MIEHTGIRKLAAELRLINQYFPDFNSRFQIKNGKVVKINLDNMDVASFTHFPITIAKFENLESLSLRNTYLMQIPEEIFEIKSLKFLDLSGNHLRKIPSQIANLENLTTLIGSNNLIEYIEDLPTGLIAVDLSNNSLDQIPMILSKCFNLEKLNFANNHIQYISPAIFELFHLKFLNLRSNFIRELPEKLSQLDQLKKLNMFNNPISKKNLEKLTTHTLAFTRVFTDIRSAPDFSNIKVLRPKIFDFRNSTKYPPTFQLTSVMIFGAPNVGKRDVVERYIDLHYIPEKSLFIQQNNYMAWDHYILEHMNEYFQFWCPNNQDITNENYRQGILNGFYYTRMVCLVFDLSRPSTFKLLIDAIDEIRLIRHQPCPIFVIGNDHYKTERFEKASILKETVEKYRKSMHINYIEISTNTGKNLDKLFEMIFSKKSS